MPARPAAFTDFCTSYDHIRRMGGATPKLAALSLQVQNLRRAGDETAREVAVVRLATGIERASRLIEQLLVLARQEASAAAGAPGADDSASGEEDVVDAEIVDEPTDENTSEGDSK